MKHKHPFIVDESATVIGSGWLALIIVALMVAAFVCGMASERVLAQHCGAPVAAPAPKPSATTLTKPVAPRGALSV